MSPFADGSVLQREKAYVFSSRNLESSYLAETLLCYVSIVSHLPLAHLDDMVLDRLCDLVEQLVHAFPSMVSASDGARCAATPPSPFLSSSFIVFRPPSTFCPSFPLLTAPPLLPPPTHRASICRAILCLLFALRDKGPALGTLLSRLVFPALVRTLSSSDADRFVHPVTGASSLTHSGRRVFVQHDPVCAWSCVYVQECVCECVYVVVCLCAFVDVFA